MHDRESRKDVLHVVLHVDEPLQLFLTSFTHKLDQLIHKVGNIMATLDDVVTKVTALGSVEDSVIALLTDIKTKLDAAIAAGADPVKLQALSDAIDSQTQRLADAVTANTPAATP